MYTGNTSYVATHPVCMVCTGWVATRHTHRVGGNTPYTQGGWQHAIHTGWVATRHTHRVVPAVQATSYTGLIVGWCNTADQIGIGVIIILVSGLVITTKKHINHICLWVDGEGGAMIHLVGQ